MPSLSTLIQKEREELEAHLKKSVPVTDKFERASIVNFQVDHDNRIIEAIKEWACKPEATIEIRKHYKETISTEEYVRLKDLLAFLSQDISK